MSSQPHCLACGSEITVTDAGYDGIKVGCDCTGLKSSIYIDWKQFYDAPMAWVYSRRSGSELKHVGNHVGRPNVNLYDEANE